MRMTRSGRENDLYPRRNMLPVSVAIRKDEQEFPVVGGGDISRHCQKSDVAEAQCPRRRVGDELGMEGRTGSGVARNASDMAFIKDANSPHFAKFIGHFSDCVILSSSAGLTNNPLLLVTHYFLTS